MTIEIDGIKNQTQDIRSEIRHRIKLETEPRVYRLEQGRKIDQAIQEAMETGKLVKVSLIDI